MSASVLGPFASEGETSHLFPQSSGKALAVEVRQSLFKMALKEAAAVHGGLSPRQVEAALPKSEPIMANEVED